jgi:methylglutaconyl-CoA hydratase
VRSRASRSRNPPPRVVEVTRRRSQLPRTTPNLSQLLVDIPAICDKVAGARARARARAGAEAGATATATATRVPPPTLRTVPDLVHLDVADGIATITLDSPSNRNALSAPLVAGLAAHLEATRADSSVRALVLTATGTVFCSGADLDNPPTTDSAVGPTYAGILTALLEYPTIVVVKLNGHVRAGGLGLVASADIVIAPEDATFAFTEVRIGVVPAIISVVCTRVMPPRAVSRYFLTGETFSAADAAAAGLVTRTAPRDHVDTVTLALLDEIRKTAPSAVAHTKGLLADLRGLDLADGFVHAARVSAESFVSEEGREGIRAFLEKRPPAWAPAPPS